MKAPTTSKGIDWKSIFRPQNIGRIFEAPNNSTVNATAYERASRYGYTIGIQRTVNPQVLLITVTGTAAAKDKFAVSAGDYNAALARDNNLAAKLTNAREELAYWRKQKVLRTNPIAKADAGARIIAWQYQVTTLTEKLTPALV